LRQYVDIIVDTDTYYGRIKHKKIIFFYLKLELLFLLKIIFFHIISLKCKTILYLKNIFKTTFMLFVLFCVLKIFT